MKILYSMFNYLSLLIFSTFISCETPAGHSGISQNIAESKRRSVFIAEYAVYPNPYRINDSMQITIKEAWLEKHWAHGKFKDETILYPTEMYQLSINSKESDLEKYIYLDYTIGVDFDKNMRPSNKESLVGDFKTLPGDTIEYKVQKDHDLSNQSEKIILGKLVLIKKK